MGSSVSMHIFLEEHLHPALHKATGNVCATLKYGWTFMVGSTVFALGSAFYYATKFSPNEGVVDRAEAWPPHVAARLRSTYIYYTSSIVIAAASVATVSQIPALLAFVSDYSLATVACGILAMEITSMVVRLIPYSEGFGVKQVAFMIHSAIIGIVFSPLCLLGQAVMVQASWLTVVSLGMVSMLTIFASTQFMKLVGVPIVICSLVTCVSTLIGMFWNTSTAMGSHSYALNLYFGLVATAGLHMCDAHFLCEVAEQTSVEDDVKYDPIDAALSLFGRTLDVFIRIAILCVGGGNGVFKRVCS